MKPKFTSSTSKNLLFSSTLAVAFSFLGQASAADLTWDTAPGNVGPGDSAITGGVGFWDTSNGNWTSNGGVSNVAWVNGTDTAVFGGVAGAVTLSENVSAGGLTFNTTGYSLLGNQTVTLAGATPTINVSVTTVNIGSSTNATVLTGTAGLTKTGVGQMIIISSVAQTYTGDTTINAGQLGVNFQTVATNMIDPASTLVMNGGAFSVLARSNAVTSQTLNQTTLASGHSVLHLNKQTVSSSGILVLSAITRNAGATVNLFTSGNGGTTRQIQSGSWPVDSSTILASGVAYATFHNLATSSGPAVFTGDDWAAYNGSTIVAPTYNASNVDPTTLTGNANISSGTDTTLAANATITSLRNNVAEARTINLGGNTLTTGGILIGSVVGPNSTTITGGTLRSAANAANKDLVIISNNTGITSVGASIANAAAGVTGLTKSGPGNLTLSGTNSYSGPTIINGGSLTSSLAAALGSTTSVSVGSGTALTVSYGGPSSYTNPQITTLLAKTTFTDATSGFGFDTTDATGGTADFAGGYSAATGLAKSGTGTLVMTGANSHTGTTSVFGGTLKIANTGALGGSALGTVVSNGAAVALEGGITITGEALSLLGEGVSQTGALRSISGNNSWTGEITLAGTARVNSDAGTLTLGAVGTSGTLELSGNGNITVGGIVSGTVGITVEDLLGDGTTSGTMTLSGPNTNSGAITIASGRLDLTGSRTGDSGEITAGTDASKTGTLNVSNGSFDLGTVNDVTVGGGTDSVGILNQTGGTITTGASTGSFVLLGQGINSTGTHNLSAGTLNVGGTNANAFILGVSNDSTGIVNLSGSGIVTATAGGLASIQIGRSNNSAATGTTGVFNQTGGTATLNDLAMGGGGANNDNTTAVLTITGGTFTVNDGFTFLSAGPNSSSTITIGGTAVVSLPRFPTGRGAGSTATITFDGGTLKPTAASATYMEGLSDEGSETPIGGATIQDGGATLDVAAGNDIIIAQNLLTHPSSLGGGLTKLGAGILGLAGVNTYTGPTNVNAGTLGVNAGASIAGAVNVASVATLAGSGTVAGALASSGTIMPGIATVTDIGTLTTGAATLSAGALAIQVSGATADKLVSTGVLTISGTTTLNVSELLAATAPSFVIAEGTSRSGEFASFSLPPGYSLTYNSTQVILNTPATGSYATWATANGIGGELAKDDFDNDGLTNLVEYALDLDPTVSTVPAGTFTGGTTLTFTKGADAIANEDVSWVIQTSTTLGNDWVDQVTQAPGDPTATISFALPIGQPKIFGRLKVVEVP